MLATSLRKGSCLSRDALFGVHVNRQGRTSVNLQRPWWPLSYHQRRLPSSSHPLGSPAAGQAPKRRGLSQPVSVGAGVSNQEPP